VIAPSSFFEPKIEVGHSLHPHQELHALDSCHSLDRRNERWRMEPNSTLSVGANRASRRRYDHVAGGATQNALPRAGAPIIALARAPHGCRDGDPGAPVAFSVREPSARRHSL
jgi:hypothetical protein